jgi:uncharacterized damage-inducible protein DinB
MLDRLRRLFTHARWADTAMFHAMAAAPDPPATALRECLHVLGAGETWLSRLEGRSARVAIWPEAPIDEAMTLAEIVHDSYGAYLKSLSAHDLDRVVAYTNSAGAAFENTVADVLTQVATHGQYHRGKANLLLRQAGLTPVPVDYIVWVRGLAGVAPKVV